MRVGWQSAQQSVSNSHLRARSRRSNSQLSAASFAHCLLNANCWRQTCRFHPELQRSCNFRATTSSSPICAYLSPIDITACRVSFERQESKILVLKAGRLSPSSTVSMIDNAKKNLHYWCKRSNESLYSLRSNLVGDPAYSLSAFDGMVVTWASSSFSSGATLNSQDKSEISADLEHVC